MPRRLRRPDGDVHGIPEFVLQLPDRPAMGRKSNKLQKEPTRRASKQTNIEAQLRSSA
jgi:hypothetical protein